MSKALNEYKLLLFDCDGVILNSNKIKSDAFFRVAEKYDRDSALELKSYNKKYGGISRYAKFKYYSEEILPKYSNADLDIEKITKNFSEIALQGLLKCQATPSLIPLRGLLHMCHFAVVSGGDQDELQYVFKERKLSEFFDYGIWGSPKTKFEIVEERFNSFEPEQVLFLGDSRSDYKVAKYFNFDFIFVSDWTEMTNWNSFVDCNSIRHTKSIEKLFLEELPVDHKY